MGEKPAGDADAKGRRTEDRGALATARKGALVAGTGFWDWAERRNIAAHACIAITLYLTIDVIQWAMLFAEQYVERDSNSVGVIIGAVLTPWGIMQAAMFKFYTDVMKSVQASVGGSTTT